jgi:hypothetical protein
MKLINSVKEATQRVAEPTPDFHKNNRNMGWWIAGAGAVIKVAGLFFPATMPAALISWAPELITLGLSIAGVSSLASTKR